ncbi:LysR family transcriptional regulator [Paraburkholderia sp. BR14374]|uniref:LysR family transcriptional regulator n=1 Tax=Paraburkholderia sp. BR14374 TaxID=3237007 RepID=UPI0034CD5B3F
MSGLNIHSLTRRIDLFTLRLFLTVVEEQQIRRAALTENVTPSATTRRIQDLVDMTGIGLLDRLPGGMVTSAAGEVLARHLRLLFANLDVMRREVSEFTKGVRGHISVSSERHHRPFSRSGNRRLRQARHPRLLHRPPRCRRATRAPGLGQGGAWRDESVGEHAVQRGLR